VRKPLYLAAAILVLAGGTMLAIYLLSLPDASPGAALPPAAVDPPPPPAVPPPAAPDLSRFQGGKAPPAPMVYAPAPPPPLPDSWEAVPLSRDRNLGPVGVALRSGLEPLAPQLQGCLAAAPGASPGGASVSSAAGDEELGDGGGAPAVVLHLETLSGQVRIVDAPVLSWAGVSEAAMGCVQAALRGRSFPAPAAQPGRKLRVVFPLPAR